MKNPQFIPATFLKLLFVVVLIILLFYGTTIILNVKAQKQAENEVINTIEAQMDYFISALESEITAMFNLHNLYVNDLQVQLISIGGPKINEYKKLEIYEDMKFRLFLMSNTGRYIQNICVDIPVLDKTVSSNYTIQPMDESMYSALSTNSNNKTNPFSSYENALYVTMKYPNLVISQSSPRYIIRIKINQDLINEDLSRQLGDDRLQSVIISNEGDWHFQSEDGVAELISPVTDLQLDDTIEDANGNFYIVRSRNSNTLDATLYTLIPRKNIMGQMVSYRFLFVLLSIATVIMTIICAFMINHLFNIPMRRLVVAFENVNQGKIHYNIRHNSKDEFAYLYNHFNSMLANIQQLIDKITEQRSLVVQAELRQLQYQIRPHFLYNSIYMIYRLAVACDNDSIANASKYLVSYYRYITRSSSALVLLSEEINHAENYVQIQRLRFGKRFIIEFPILPAGYDDMLVPTLFLQPIIENAFEHGLEKEEYGYVGIFFEETEQNLSIVVEDNGPGVTDEKYAELEGTLRDEGSGGTVTGLINVHRRLMFIFGSGYGISIGKSAHGGMRVVIKLPGKEKNKNV